MRVTDAAWAEQVKRADDAEMREAGAYVGIRQVLREHGARGCMCRHTERILTEILKAVRCNGDGDRLCCEKHMGGNP